MNQLMGAPFGSDVLRELAAGIGSDCPFFIDSVPAVMRGRGEIIEPLGPALTDRLRGRRLVLFRPDFGVETAWAYGRLAAAAPGSYDAETRAVARLDALITGGTLGEVLFNSFEPVVGRKYLAIATLLDQLRGVGVDCLMSGSGSCCFALVGEAGASTNEIEKIVRNAWGQAVFWVETSIG
jgi:4-diphosphocytidyl-2-C-methyl-D-erythritol kinase